MNIIEADGESLLVALRKLLTEKNLVTDAELAERMAATDNASPGQGARMVARAWKMCIRDRAWCRSLPTPVPGNG